MKKIILLLIILTSSIVIANDYILVTGTGKSEEEAKKNAFAIAIEQALGVMVSSEILVENGELIKEKITSNSQGYIEKYNIIASGKDGDTYVVSLKAKVSKPKLVKELEVITHLNDAQHSYNAVKCSQGYNNSVWCKGGDIAISDMNFGIYSDSQAHLRQYRSDFVETQLFFRVTLREKAYFNKATDQNGTKLEFIYVDMPKDKNQSTVSEEFIIKLGSNDNLKLLKKYADTGLDVKFIGSNKTITFQVPAAYIEGFIKYIETNYTVKK